MALLAGALVLAVVGLCDDRFGLPPLVRLVVQAAVAVAFVRATGGLERMPLPPPLDPPLGPLGPVLSVVWIVAVVNFYNFMDGIDGLAGLQAAITGVGIALASPDPFSTVLGGALAAAAAGFLVFNWSPASIFLGDSGSGVVGYTLAALPFLTTLEARSPLVWLIAVSLWFFLVDATWTLLRRAGRGERLHQAHREHLYQRLVISGWSHARVAAGLGAGALVLTALALIAVQLGSTAVSWAVLLAAAALFGLELRLVESREARLRGGPGRVEVAS
jgi:UDP-N-acetylmuramyl pentapeptide phosphotransferase/UDP-N-acetylglucosamine-1-phosphate transferase